MKEILDEVAAEREYALKKWGEEFDDKNTLNDWAVYINIYLSKALAMGASKEDVEKNLTKALGLVVSALIRVKEDTLAPRHYD